MVLDYEIEFSAGLNDAEKDIAKHGLKYARDLMIDQDKNDPYIKGYLAYYNDYVSKNGEYE